MLVAPAQKTSKVLCIQELFIFIAILVGFLNAVRSAFETQKAHQSYIPNGAERKAAQRSLCRTVGIAPTGRERPIGERSTH
jgi:hypothetical protein